MRVYMILLGLVVAISAQAASSVYPDRVAWDAATQNVTLLDFEGIVSDNTANNFTPSTLVGGVNFSVVGDTELFIVDSDDLGTQFLQDIYNWGSGDVLSWQQGGPTIGRATLPAGTTAFAVDLMPYGFIASPPAVIYGSSVQITLSTGEVFQVSGQQRPARAFFGIIADAPVAWVDFELLSDTGGLNVDNVAYGIPEPATAILAVGVCTLLAMRRTNRRWRAW